MAKDELPPIFLSWHEDPEVVQYLLEECEVTAEDVERYKREGAELRDAVIALRAALLTNNLQQIVAAAHAVTNVGKEEKVENKN